MADRPLALALHGGAGAIPRSSAPGKRREVLEALRRILAMGREWLLAGGSALDVAEAVVRELEDDPHFNAGRGAVLNREGEHELEASIMCGATHQGGAVTGLRTVRHPISLARRVLERPDLVFLAGEGAEAMARETGLETVEPAFFTTPRRVRQLEKFQREQARPPEPERHREHATSEVHADPECGTVGCVVLDHQGNLAAATSTGGRTGKPAGRIGDSPILGAGNYANRWCAVSGTGVGEKFLRFTVARDVAARMEFAGLALEEACRILVEEVLEEGDGGLIAVDREGRIAMPFNSTGMYRAAFSTRGVEEVGIWQETLPGRAG